MVVAVPASPMSSTNSIFPLTPAVDTEDDQARSVDLFSEEGGRMLDALGSDTARTILAALAEEPATTSDIAETVDSTLQNVHYHVERLVDAGLVRVVDTHYSSRGAEMDVYAVDGAPLMLVGGEGDTDATVEEAADSLGDSATSGTLAARSD